MTARNRLSGIAFVVAGLSWALVVTTGLVRLWAYANTPGPAVATSASWPSASSVARAPRQPTLVMFAHPHCPCSRASVGELALLMARAQGRVRMHVIVYRPADAEPGWERTDIWQSAAAIPGVDVRSDEDGRDAGVFGAAVSGQTLLYDADGRLVFSGGITASRGHSGDNVGRSALVALLTEGATTPTTTRTPVFGCFLSDAPDRSSRQRSPGSSQ